MAQLWCSGEEQPLITGYLSMRQRLAQASHVVVGAKRRGGQEDFDIAVDQLLTHLASGNESGERDHHGADSCRREHPDDELGAIRVEQPHVRSLAGALGDQSAGELRRTAVGVGIADAVTVADQKRVAAARAGLVSQGIGDGGGVTGHGRCGRWIR